MPSAALVIGCDAYPAVTGGGLRGAVADALAVRAWLLDAQGGRVEAKNLTFLASPSDAGAQLGAVDRDGPATRGEFVNAVGKLIDRRDVGPDDRLYVYFAGHGCRTDPINPVLSRDALAFTEFQPSDPAAGAAGVEDLLARLGQSRFGTIVVLLDACRNFPFARPFQLGGLGLDPEAPFHRNYEPRVFLFQATVSGGQAEGDESDGVWHGKFTAALLRGLAGEGTAKLYDETAEVPYVVRWSSLTSFVEASVPRQCPRPRGEGEITFAVFPDGWFAPVRLEVMLAPDEATKASDLSVRVRYFDPTSADSAVQELRGPPPLVATVPPRRHRVSASGAGYAGGRSFDVYADQAVTVPLVPGGPVIRSLHPIGPVRRGGSPDGGIDVSADDPAAALEVRDTSGVTRLRGAGTIQAALGAGSYSLVLLDPDGRDQSEPLDVQPGRVTETTLTAPHPPGLLRSSLHADGPLQWATGAAVLAVACGVEAEAGEGWPDAEVLVAIAGPTSMSAARPLPGRSGWPVTLKGLTGVLGDGVWQRVMKGPAPAGALSFDVDHWRLTVPTLASAITAVMFDLDSIIVGIFDRALLTDPFAVLRLDRAQRLIGAGRPRSAASLLDAIESQDGAGRVTESLRTAPGVSETAETRVVPVPALIAGTPIETRAGLLHAGPWAVLIERVGER